MRIVMLGTGAALPDPDRCHSSILITLDSGRHLMLDCGHGATRQLMRIDVNPAEVGDLFLTHLHHDHVCELPFFVISGWILNRVGALNIFGPDGTKKLVGHLFENGAFDADIRARGAYPARQANMEAIRPRVTEYASGVICDDGEIRVTAALMDHIPQDISPCYGFRIEAEGKVVVFSGDTAPCDNILALSHGADLLIHECTFPEAFIEHRRQSKVGTFSHTSPHDLGKLAVEAGVKQLVATHIGHVDSLSPVLKRAAKKHLPVELMGPHQIDAFVSEIRSVYRGPLRIAHDLMRIDL
jgi:ribonuclease Z